MELHTDWHQWVSVSLDKLWSRLLFLSTPQPSLRVGVLSHSYLQTDSWISMRDLGGKARRGWRILLTAAAKLWFRLFSGVYVLLPAKSIPFVLPLIKAAASQDFTTPPLWNNKRKDGERCFLEPNAGPVGKWKCSCQFHLSSVAPCVNKQMNTENAVLCWIDPFREYIMDTAGFRLLLYLAGHTDIFKTSWNTCIIYFTLIWTWHINPSVYLTDLWSYCVAQLVSVWRSDGVYWHPARLQSVSVLLCLSPGLKANWSICILLQLTVHNDLFNLMKLQRRSRQGWRATGWWQLQKIAANWSWNRGKGKQRQHFEREWDEGPRWAENSCTIVCEITTSRRLL